MTRQNNSRKEEGNAVHCLEAQWILFNHVEIEKKPFSKIHDDTEITLG